MWNLEINNANVLNNYQQFFLNNKAVNSHGFYSTMQAILNNWVKIKDLRAFIANVECRLSFDFQSEIKYFVLLSIRLQHKCIRIDLAPDISLVEKAADQNISTTKRFPLPVHQQYQSSLIWQVWIIDTETRWTMRAYSQFLGRSRINYSISFFETK